MISITKGRLVGLASASALIATMAVATMPSATFAAVIFNNGNFEAATPAGPATLGKGSTVIDGWTVTGTDVDYTDFWTAQGGTKSIDLNGFGQGGIEQSFPTTIGGTYVVTFSLSGNPGTHEQFPNGEASLPIKTMTVHATGGLTTPYSFDTATLGNTFADMMWQTQTYTFKATSATTTLSFASTTVGAFGPAIDTVSVTQTVATGADCKNSGWKTMHDSVGNSFRNQGDCVSFYATGEKNLAN